MQMAVDLVNTLDPIAQEDRLETVSDLKEFLAQYERDWPAQDWHPGEPSRADLQGARELRDKLREVFSAQSDDEAATLLNRILSEASVVPRISMHSADPHLHFEPQGGGTSAWLAAATAMGLGVMLCDFGLERFGICSSDTCVDVYIDGSKNRSRRHCSTTCATRVNVAALRQRRRQTEQPPAV